MSDGLNSAEDLKRAEMKLKICRQIRKNSKQLREERLKIVNQLNVYQSLNHKRRLLQEKLEDCNEILRNSEK